MKTKIDYLKKLSVIKQNFVKFGTVTITFNLKSKINLKSAFIEWPNYKTCYYVSETKPETDLKIPYMNTKQFVETKKRKFSKKTILLSATDSVNLLKVHGDKFKKLYSKPLIYNPLTVKDSIYKLTNTTKLNVTCKKTFSFILCKTAEELSVNMLESVMQIVANALSKELKTQPVYQSIYLKCTQSKALLL